MYRPSTQRRPRRGTAAVEFALIAPVLLIILLGLWEFGRIVEVQQILDNAVREAGRQAATGSYNKATVENRVRQYLQRAGLSATAASAAQVAVTNVSSGADPTAATQLDHFQITLSIRYDDVRISPLRLLTSPATRLHATADWYSMRDLPLEVSVDVPLQ